jgi:TonB family protein
MKRSLIKVGSDIKRKSICLLLSLAVHFLLFYIVLHLVSPVKVYDIKEEITNLIIVPPEKLFIPQGYEDFKEGHDFDDLLPRGGARQRRPSRRTEISGEERAPGVEVSAKATNNVPPSGSRMESQEAQMQAERLSPESKMSSGFKLKLPRDINPNLPPDNDLNLSPYFEREGKDLSKIDRDKLEKILSQYLYTDLSRIPAVKGKSPSGSFEDRQSHGEGKVSFNIKGYDITPWATEVVNKIQTNWIIPSSQSQSIKGTVRFFVVVDADGEITSIEMVESTEVSALDLLALNAINSSLPFPRLPDDFPSKKLEAYLVFNYND